jgi:uncharacterized protein YndB with AHSA1/START domain
MYGELHAAKGRSQLRFERTLPHSREKVWRALTEPEHLAAWFPTTIEGERVAGAPLRFSFPNDEAPPMEGEMITYDPPSVLEFRWGEDVVRFELAPNDGGSLLTLVDTLDEHGKAARDAAGWHVCLDVLDSHLAGAEGPEASSDQWKPLNDEYAERFGPEAATIGPPDGFE